MKRCMVMKCAVQKENERLRRENEGLKEKIESLKSKIIELMQNFGKDKDEDQQR